MSSLSFTKLFSSITDSSVWQESSDVRVVWVTLMAMADPLGRVHAAVPGLARRANVSREATEQALTVFLSPDPDSRSKEHDGRRIEEIDGGWRLLNYIRHREMRDEEARKEKNRIYQDRFRSKTESKESKILSDKNLTVRNVRQSKTMSAQEEEEVEVEVDIKKVQKPSRNKSEPDPRHTPFRLACESYAKFKGVTFTWDVSEATQLSLLLKAAPTLTLAIFQQCLRNRAGTPTAIHCDRPRMWLPTILSFEQSAQNQFKQPEGTTNGTFKGKTEHSIDAGDEAIAIIRAQQARNDRAASEALRGSEAGEIGYGGLLGLCGGSG